MSAIKIYVDSIEIDFVRSTLSLKKENNSFSKDFKVSHTTFPFLIIENDITKKALGPRDITSVIKTKTIACKVVELGVEYNGELQILSYLDGYRKSNLKYASAILPLLNTKIASYLPTVSVIPNESNPEPYSETSESELIGSENYPDFVRDQIFKVFPQASFQFPVVKFSNKFEGETGNGETWQSYSGNINNHTVNPATGLNTFTENSYQFNGVNGTYTVFNTNVNTPYLFLLTPLKAVFDSIGFKIKGNFTTNSFIRRLLMYSKNNNLTAVKLVPNKGYFSLAGLDWDFTFAEFPHWYKRSYLEINTAETYEIKFKLKTPHNGSNQLVKIFSRDVYGDRQQVMVRLITSSNQNDFYEGSYTYSMPAAEVGQSIAFEYFNSHKVDPSFFEVSANVKDAERDYMQMHPTIDLKRYCPDWTVATYINELKKLFNLKVDSDDIKKEITLNFNETLTDTQTPHISNKSLKVNSFDASKHTSFILKYDNDLDEAIYITRTNQEAYKRQ